MALVYLLFTILDYMWSKNLCILTSLKMNSLERSCLSDSKSAQHSSFHHKQQNEKLTLVTVASTCFQASLLKLAKNEEHRLRLFLIYLYLQLIQNYSHNTCFA